MDAIWLYISDNSWQCVGEVSGLYSDRWERGAVVLVSRTLRYLT